MKLLSIQAIDAVFARDRQKLDQLNELLEDHSTITPTQIVAATGCDLSDAMAIIVLLYQKRMADIVLLVFHELVDEVPVLRYRFDGAMPPLPPVVDTNDGEHEVGSEAEFWYSFELDLRSTEFQLVP